MHKIDKIEEIDDKTYIKKALENYKNVCYKCKSNPIWKICLCEGCYNKLIGGKND